jgi:hypothetical protein
MTPTLMDLVGEETANNMSQASKKYFKGSLPIYSKS